MGGGYYQGDVAERSRSTSEDHFVHTARMAEAPVEERRCHNSLNPFLVVRECCDNPQHPDTTPIAVMLDVTRSRGKDAREVYKKLPMFIGQIHLRNYAPDPEVCFSAVGDAYYDRAPFQVGQYESDNRLDTDLANVWLEEGGGGTGQESYELGAYFFARHTKLDCLKRGKKGILFIFGDEGFYPVADAGQIHRIFGERLQRDVMSKNIFEELQVKYETYLIFPRATWEQRRADIDEEIKQRVTDAGGMYADVDIRFSLIWNNHNDLDLHVKTPAGHHIYYGSKRAPCSGELDVDRNVRGETDKPVENTRWARGKGRRGNYEVWVENYNFHESNHAATDFKVEIEINGKVQHFSGKTPQGKTHDASRVEVGTFFYDPEEREKEAKPDKRYEAYNDDKIKAQWAKVLPSEHILMIDNAKAGVDIMLGVLALTNGTRTLPEYLKDMKERDQTDQRVEEVRNSLANLAELVCAKQVKVDLPEGKTAYGKRKTAYDEKRARSKRL